MTTNHYSQYDPPNGAREREPYCEDAGVPMSQCVACMADARLVEAAELLDRAYAGHGLHGLLASLEAVIALLPGDRGVS